MFFVFSLSCSPLRLPVSFVWKNALHTSTVRYIHGSDGKHNNSWYQVGSNIIPEYEYVYHGQRTECQVPGICYWPLGNLTTAHTSATNRYDSDIGIAILDITYEYIIRLAHTCSIMTGYVLGINMNATATHLRICAYLQFVRIIRTAICTAAAHVRIHKCKVKS